LVARPSHDGVQHGDTRLAKHAQDADMSQAARKSARESQADAWAPWRLAQLAVGKRTEFVLSRAKPAEGSGNLAFFCHLSILVPSPRRGRPFDRGMLVL
jgi:hypothetical protein